MDSSKRTSTSSSTVVGQPKDIRTHDCGGGGFSQSQPHAIDGVAMGRVRGWALNGRGWRRCVRLVAQASISGITCARSGSALLRHYRVRRLQSVHIGLAYCQRYGGLQGFSHELPAATGGAIVRRSPKALTITLLMVEKAGLPSPDSAL